MISRPGTEQGIGGSEYDIFFQGFACSGYQSFSLRSIFDEPQVLPKMRVAGEFSARFSLGIHRVLPGFDSKRRQMCVVDAFLFPVWLSGGRFGPSFRQVGVALSAVAMATDVGVAALHLLDRLHRRLVTGTDVHGHQLVDNWIGTQ